MKEGFLTAGDGLRLFYRRFGGDGRTLVVPNGMYLLPPCERLAAGRTLVIYDPRNRGRSDRAGGERAAGSIRQDVADLEAVRRHLGAERIDLLGHSYAGFIVALYAIEHPRRVGRQVLMSPMEPRPGKEYPAHLRNTDGVAAEVFARIEALRAEPVADPVERCERVWRVLRRLYVADERHADAVDFGRCHLENERAFMAYWMTALLPSIQQLELSEETLAGVAAPTLILHGRQDRSAPYGGAREWATLLPEARLVTLDASAHAPWLEEPDVVFEALEDFLGGTWPAAAERVESVS